MAHNDTYQAIKKKPITECGCDSITHLGNSKIEYTNPNEIVTKTTLESLNKSMIKKADGADRNGKKSNGNTNLVVNFSKKNEFITQKFKKELH